MMESNARLQVALMRVRLGTLVQKFIEERIDDKNFNYLSDADLIRLGVETMGARINLGAKMKKRHALSMLQNGKIPVMEPEILDEIFQMEEPREAFVHFRNGFASLGLYMVAKKLPLFIHLLRPRNVPLTFRRLIQMLKPDFHEEGSNARKYENEIYMQFLVYVREAASGRREKVSLHDILLFITGTCEEPILGFALNPSISFPVVDNSFLPTSSTCINRLNLPRPTSVVSVPEKDNLFNLYDFAFSNAFFGIK